PIIEGSRAEVVDLDPGLALVGRAKDASGGAVGVAARELADVVVHRLVGLYHGIDDARVLAIDGKTAATERTLGQALDHLRPGLPDGVAVGQPAAGPGLHRGVAGGVAVAPHLVHGRIDRLGIGRVEDDIDAAGVGVDEKHLLPGLAAVVGLEEAAFLVRRPQ